jgi:hypothetical protein
VDIAPFDNNKQGNLKNMKKAIFFTMSCGNDKENEFESCRGEGRISINTAFGFSLLDYECYIVNNWKLESPKKIWKNVYIINKPDENEKYNIAFSIDINDLKNKNNYEHKILVTYEGTAKTLETIKEENLTDIILVCNVPCMMHDPTHINYKYAQYLPTIHPVPSVNIGFLPYKFDPKLPELKVLLYHSTWQTTVPRNKYYAHKQQLMINILNQRYKVNLYILVADEKAAKECSLVYDLSQCNKIHYINNENMRYDDIIELILNVDLCLLVGGTPWTGPLVLDAISLGRPMIYAFEGPIMNGVANNNDLCKCIEYIIIGSETDKISIKKIITQLNNLEIPFNCYRDAVKDYDFNNWKRYAEELLTKNCRYNNNRNKINNENIMNINNNIEIIGITTCGTYPAWTAYTVASFYNHVDKIVVVNAGYDIFNPDSGAIHPLSRDHEQLKELDINNKIIEYTPTQNDIDKIFETSCTKGRDEYGRSTNMTLSTQLAYKSFTIPNGKHNWILKLDNDQILYQITRKQLIDIIEKYPKETGFRFAQYADYIHDFDHIGSLPDEFTNDGSLLHRAIPNQSYRGQGSPGNIKVTQYKIYSIQTSHMRRINPPDVDNYEYLFKRYWYHTFGPNSIMEHDYNRKTGEKLTSEMILKIANNSAIDILKSKGNHILDLPKDIRIPYSPPLVCTMQPLEYIKKGY